MIEERLFLILAYLVVTTLLLCFYFYSEFSRLTKNLTVLLVTLSYFYTWFSVEGLLGWPSQEEMPSQFRVLWIDVNEPDKGDSEDGDIFFWVKELNKVDQPYGKPRAYSIKWSEENAKKAEEAITKMEDGEILNGNISRNILTGDQEKSDGAVNEKEGTSSTDEGEPTFQFKEVSPPVLPTKSPLN